MYQKRTFTSKVKKLKKFFKLNKNNLLEAI